MKMKYTCILGNTFFTEKIYSQLFEIEKESMATGQWILSILWNYKSWKCLSSALVIVSRKDLVKRIFSYFVVFKSGYKRSDENELMISYKKVMKMNWWYAIKEETKMNGWYALKEVTKMNQWYAIKEVTKMNWWYAIKEVTKMNWWYAIKEVKKMSWWYSILLRWKKVKYMKRARWRERQTDRQTEAGRQINRKTETDSERERERERESPIPSKHFDDAMIISSTLATL